MSGQLESPHFFRTGDLVQNPDGSIGTVVDATTLFATIGWRDGDREEVDQFDPRFQVIQRAEAAG